VSGIQNKWFIFFPKEHFRQLAESFFPQRSIFANRRNHFFLKGTFSPVGGTIFFAFFPLICIFAKTKNKKYDEEESIYCLFNGSLDTR
jgi:hypothetical protein